MIRILNAGVLDTVQDNGRFGFAKWGVNCNGSMDRFASQVANALVANELDASVLELHFPAPEILFMRDALISLTGANFSPMINGNPVPVWKTIQVPSGAVLTFAKKINGMRCYLSVHGGFEISKWLGSSSTNLKSATGGFHGRAFRKGDTQSITKGRFQSLLKSETFIFPWAVNYGFAYEHEEILITSGNEWSWLDQKSEDIILTGKMSITSSSDRMASILRNDAITLTRKDQLLSSVVTFGTIQALPSGGLCVLMADHQTTGGYPRVAHIVSAHLPKFSQLSPGEIFGFSRTNITEAEKMLLSLNSVLVNLKNSLLKKLSDHYGID